MAVHKTRCIFLHIYTLVFPERTQTTNQMPRSPLSPLVVPHIRCGFTEISRTTTRNMRQEARNNRDQKQPSAHPPFKAVHTLVTKYPALDTRHHSPGRASWFMNSRQVDSASIGQGLEETVSVYNTASSPELTVTGKTSVTYGYANCCCCWLYVAPTSLKKSTS